MVRKIRRPFRRKRPMPRSAGVHPGAAPGVLRASPLSHPSQVFLIGYGPEGYVEHACRDVGEIQPFLSAWPVVWVNVVGLGSVETIEQLGALFGLERLLLEDVLDASHRPKVEYYENYVFAILKGGILSEQFESEQISLFLKKNAVIAFEEKPGSSFSQVRERIRRGTGKIRFAGADYLFYALLDEVIDKYFPILDSLNHRLAALEDDIMAPQGATNDREVIQQVHHAKSDLLLLHRTVWPISDIVSMMMREDTPLITKPTRTFLRDCYDHSIQANELAQFYRDTASGLLNTFLAYEGHKTNETIKVLTLVSAVFIPLNFIASIYGMNFANMPEINSQYGYATVMGFMLAVATGMILFFRRRGWIGK